MFKLTTLSNEPNQQISITLNDTDRVVLTFEYRPNQLGWFFSFEYNEQLYQNIRLTTAYNILRAYRNWLPFGLRCDTLDNEEPIDLNDFATGYATIYLIPQKELSVIEGAYYAKD